MKDMKIPYNFYKLQKCQGPPWASIIATCLIKLLRTGPLVLFYFQHSYISKSEQTPTNLFHPHDKSVTEYSIQFNVHRTSIVKVTFNRNSGSAHTSLLSTWTPANLKLFKMHETSYWRRHFWRTAVSCASWMGKKFYSLD